MGSDEFLIYSFTLYISFVDVYAPYELVVSALIPSHHAHVKMEIWIDLEEFLYHLEKWGYAFVKVE